MLLRKADISDIEGLMRIFAQARSAQREAGFVQWEDGYPSAEILTADIYGDIGYVMDDEDKMAGYVAIAPFDKEYEKFPQLWRCAGAYAVFHRIAIADGYRGKGISKTLFDLAENKSRDMGAVSIRIDTGIQNRPMQHILIKRNYANLGTRSFSWGPRLAFEKSLDIVPDFAL